MILQSYIKPKKFIGLIPFIGNSTASTIFTIIFLPEKVYDDLRRSKPNPKSLALLAHEEVHRKRQIKLGSIKYGFKYLLNPKFRFEEELIADREYVRILDNNRISFDVDKRAKELSGPAYLWSVDYQTAKTALNSLLL